MSPAREKLLATLLESFAPNGDEMWNIGDDERRQANALIDAFAHELAERQRAAIPDIMEEWGGYLHQDMLSDVIKVIDPEVPGG